MPSGYVRAVYLIVYLLWLLGIARMLDNNLLLKYLNSRVYNFQFYLGFIRYQAFILHVVSGINVKLSILEVQISKRYDNVN